MPLPPSRVQTESDLDSEDTGAVEDVDFAAEVAAASGEITAGDFEVPPADRKPPPPRRSGKPLLPQAKRPRNKPWWETLFGDDFQRAYRPMTAVQLKREGDFVVDSLQLPRGSVLLDLGCGQGELSIELTLRGYSVVGYDLSVYQLAMAGDNAQTAGQKINFLQGDMREMAFDNMFDGVLCWDTTFGYFEEDKNIEVLQRIKKALKPGGRLLLDILNRDFVSQQAPYNHWFEGDGCVCMDDMNMDWISNRLRVKRSIILDDGRSKEQQYSIRLYSLSDIGRLLHEVGFRVSAVSGGIATRGAFFGPASRRIIIEAIKPT
jgi:SAM-dependent methyltransferase